VPSNGLRKGELAGLWRALAINEAAVQKVFDSVSEGMVPNEMNEIFRAEVKRRGVDVATGTAFVVADGGAGPKLRSHNPLKPGDMYGMDFQLAVNGFQSDIGRYAIFGKHTADQKARHQKVLDTAAEIASWIRPGETLKSVFDRCPKDKWSIESHRVGTDVHEQPMFSTAPGKDPNFDTKVQLGSVMCVEIWAAWDGGIEDEYLVTEDGLVQVTSLPREFATRG